MSPKTPAAQSAVMKAAARAVAVERKAEGHYEMSDSGWKHIPAA